MQPPLIQGLLNPNCYPHDVETLDVVETHISWVLLTGPFAYKIKKPVKLPFLDFSTLALRRRYCEEEIRINRRLAPEIYLEVATIGGPIDAPRVGASPALEYAVKMRQFDQGVRLDRQIAKNRVSAEAIRRFAREIADFHTNADPIVGPDPKTSLLAAAENIVELESYIEPDGLIDELGELRTWTDVNAKRIAPAVRDRVDSNAYRDCHGDLHLENVIFDRGRLLAFDALEFDASRRRMDTMAEVAFFTMDLAAHDRPDLAFCFLSEYCEHTGDYEGLELLRFYMVYCALVRAKVAAIKAGDRRALRASPTVGKYIGVASDLTHARRPLLLITHGLSGSGKTFATDKLIPAIQAVRARSDLERKRLTGLSALADSNSPPGAGIYSPDISQQTYARLRHAAELALRNGFNCIVDAAFLHQVQRRQFRALAEELGARYAILHCDISESCLRERIRERRARGLDASEADEHVLDRQLAVQEPLSNSEVPMVHYWGSATGNDFEHLVAQLSSAILAA